MELIVNGQTEEPVKKVKLHKFLHHKEIERRVRQLINDRKVTESQNAK